MAKSLQEQFEELKRKVEAIEAGRKGVDKYRRNLAKAAAEYEEEYQKLVDGGLAVSVLEGEGIKPVARVLYEMYRDYRSDDKTSNEGEEETAPVRQDTAEEDAIMTPAERQPHAEGVGAGPGMVPETNWNQQ